MRVINLVDNLEKINFGIWDAAVSTAPYLESMFGVKSHLWFPAIKNIPPLPSVSPMELRSFEKKELEKALITNNLKPSDTVIVSHGCWQFPTRWGYRLKKLGFKWVMVPHGMLEPWSMQQKRLKKALYFKLIEHHLMQQADSVRAVGTPELHNLRKLRNIEPVLIPNGIPPVKNHPAREITNKPCNYLFMARLHRKKGVVPLVKAWLESSLAKQPGYSLTIAGPDDGELAALQALLKNEPGSNVKYVGAVYNLEKKKLMSRSHFYLLPSFGEGFPTSLLEAMQHGLVPIITNGCNFPEAMTRGLAIEVLPEKDSILKGLEHSRDMTISEWKDLSGKASLFVNDNYSLEIIARQQYKLYQQLLDQIAPDMPR